jgi:large subunit ribosomal protein L14
VTISDSCGAWVARIFHIYRGSRHRSAKTGDFVKISVRQAAPLSNIQRGFKSKALVIRTRAPSPRRDGSHVMCSDNSLVLLKKRLTPRGKELVGPITYGLRRRKVVASFLGVI